MAISKDIATNHEPFWLLFQQYTVFIFIKTLSCWDRLQSLSTPNGTKQWEMNEWIYLSLYVHYANYA